MGPAYTTMMGTTRIFAEQRQKRLERRGSDIGRPRGGLRRSFIRVAPISEPIRRHPINPIFGFSLMAKPVTSSIRPFGCVAFTYHPPPSLSANGSRTIISRADVMPLLLPGHLLIPSGFIRA
jgi:hypothetical protein